MSIFKLLSTNDSTVTVYGPSTFLISRNESSGNAVFATENSVNVHLVDDTEKDIDLVQVFENKTGMPISRKGILFDTEELKKVISGCEASFLIDLVVFNTSHPNFPTSELIRVLQTLKESQPLNQVLTNLTLANEDELEEFLVSKDIEMVKLAYQILKQNVFYRRLADTV